MSFIQDFKRFISRSNVVDMAVGIILGASFTKIIDVMVNHILMPPLGILMGGVDLNRFKIVLKHPTDISPAITMDVGLFINAFFNFFIVGMGAFVLIKVLSKFYMKAAIFTKKNCPECKMEIPIDARRCGFCTSELSEKC